MSCPRLDRYLDGTLTSQASDDISVHLEQCPRCLDAVEEWRSIEQQIQALEQSAWQPSEFGVKRLVATAAEARQKVDGDGLAARWGALLGVIVGAGAMAAVMLAVLSIVVEEPRGEVSGNTLALLNDSGAVTSWIDEPDGTSVRTPPRTRRVFRLGKDRFVLDASSRARVLEARRSRVRIKLVSGRGVFEVAKRKEKQIFEVETSAGTVRVVGTRFLVEHQSADTLRVVVTEGTVEMLLGNSAPQRLVQGKALEVDAGGRATVRPMRPREARSITALLNLGRESAPQQRPAAAPHAVVAEPPPTPEQEPISPHAHWSAWIDEGNFDAANQAIDEYLRRWPDDGVAWLLLARAKEEGRQWRGAVKAYDRVIALGNAAQAGQARYASARILHQQLGKHSRAVKLLDGLLRLEPVPQKAARAMLLLAQALHMSDQPDEARQWLYKVTADYGSLAAADEAKRLLAEWGEQ